MCLKYERGGNFSKIRGVLMCYQRLFFTLFNTDFITFGCHVLAKDHSLSLPLFHHTLEATNYFLCFVC